MTVKFLKEKNYQKKLSESSGANASSEH